MENTTEKDYQVREKSNGEFVVMTAKKAAKVGQWSSLRKEFDTLAEAEHYAWEFNNARESGSDRWG